MARMNDDSPYHERWTNKKLFDELMRTANLRDFGGMDSLEADRIRERTRLYRDTWMNPLIRELAKRMKVEINEPSANS